jgi:ubiquinone/menaquinone biosynthesis C-methylase UbiE
MEICEKFKGSTIEQWEKILLIALHNHKIEGVEFPRYTHISNLGSATPEESIKEAIRFYRETHRAAWLENMVFDKNTKILDFGCGSTARLGRSFYRDVPRKNVYGIDAMKENIDICKKDISGGNFQLINTKPPIPFEDNTFDYIVSYSVFSHLSQAHGLDWITELARVLKPNGMICITSFGLGHYEVIMQSDPETLPPRRRTVHRNYFEKHGRVPEFLKKGELIYIPSDGEVFDAMEYGWSLLSRKYIERMWGDLLEVVYDIDHPDVLEQAFFALRKK